VAEERKPEPPAVGQERTRTSQEPIPDGDHIEAEAERAKEIHDASRPEDDPQRV